MTARPIDKQGSPQGHQLPMRVIPPAQAKAMIYKEAIENGLKPSEIALKLHLPIKTVHMWMKNFRIEQKAEDVSELVKQAVLQDKVPVLSAIADNGLIALFEWLSNFVASGKHRNMKVDEAKGLTSLIERLHSMYRLELGKSTAQVDVMIEKTSRNINVILANLSKPPEQGGDPFGVTIDAAAIREPIGPE